MMILMQTEYSASSSVILFATHTTKAVTIASITGTLLTLLLVALLFSYENDVSFYYAYAARARKIEFISQSSKSVTN